MSAAVVFDADGSKVLTVEDKEAETVLDIKRIINKEDPASVCLIFRGKPINDRTPLEALGQSVSFVLVRDIAFNRIASEDDLYVPDMVSRSDYLLHRKEDGQGRKHQAGDEHRHGDERRHEAAPAGGPGGQQPRRAAPDAAGEMRRIRINGVVHAVRKSDVFSYNGVEYLVTSRRKRLTLRNVLKYLESFFTPTFAAQCIILFLIAMTRNIFLLTIIIFIRVMRLLSHFCVQNGVYFKFRGHVSKSVFLFLASLLLLDHMAFVSESGSV